MPAFLARSTLSLFKRSVTFLLDIGRMTYAQKVFWDFGFGKRGEVVKEDELQHLFHLNFVRFIFTHYILILEIINLMRGRK